MALPTVTPVAKAQPEAVEIAMWAALAARAADQVPLARAARLEAAVGPAKAELALAVLRLQAGAPAEALAQVDRPPLAGTLAQVGWARAAWAAGRQ